MNETLKQEMILTMNLNNLTDISKLCAKYSTMQGFECSWQTVPEKLCLIHSEVSEALEAHRKDNRENFNEELADILIRTFDLCGRLQVDIHKVVLDKMLKNCDRPIKHGKNY